VPVSRLLPPLLPCLRERPPAERTIELAYASICHVILRLSAPQKAPPDGCGRRGHYCDAVELYVLLFDDDRGGGRGEEEGGRNGVAASEHGTRDLRPQFP